MVNLYKILSRKGTAFAFLLGLITMVIFAIPVINGIDSFNALSPETQNTSNIFNTGLYIMLGLLALSVVITILWAILQMAMNPSGAKHGLIWIAMFVLLFLVGFFLLNKPDNQAVLDDLKTNGVELYLSKYIGGMLWVMLLMILISFGVFIFYEVRNLFK